MSSMVRIHPPPPTFQTLEKSRVFSFLPLWFSVLGLPLSTVNFPSFPPKNGGISTTKLLHPPQGAFRQCPLGYTFSKIGRGVTLGFGIVTTPPSHPLPSLPLLSHTVHFPPRYIDQRLTAPQTHPVPLKVLKTVARYPFRTEADVLPPTSPSFGNRHLRFLHVFSWHDSSFLFVVVQLLRVRLCDAMDYSTPGFPVPHSLPEFA